MKTREMINKTVACSGIMKFNVHTVNHIMTLMHVPGRGSSGVALTTSQRSLLHTYALCDILKLQGPAIQTPTLCCPLVKRRTLLAHGIGRTLNNPCLLHSEQLLKLEARISGQVLPKFTLNAQEEQGWWYAVVLKRNCRSTTKSFRSMGGHVRRSYRTDTIAQLPVDE